MEPGDVYEWQNLNIEYLGVKSGDKNWFKIVGELIGPMIYLSDLEVTNLFNDSEFDDDFEIPETSEW